MLKQDNINQNQSIFNIAYAFCLLAVFFSMIGIINLILLCLKQQSKDICIFYAIGMSKKRIYWEYIFNWLVVASFSMIMGSLFSIIIRYIFFKMVFRQLYLLHLLIIAVLFFL